METWLKILLVIAGIIVFFVVILPILVIIIASLVFLLNPTQIGTENCIGFQTLPIGDFKLSDGGLEMEVTNMTGRTISDVIFTATFDDGAVVIAPDVTSITANAEANLIFANPLDAGNQSIDLTVSYNDGDYTRNATATCKGTI